MRRSIEWFRFRADRRVWRVVFRPRLLDESTGQELLGRCMYTRRTIEISAAQPVEDICHTLIHELMHCAAQGFEASELDPTAEERLITASESRLWGIMAQLGFTPPDFPKGFEAMHRVGKEARGL